LVGLVKIIGQNHQFLGVNNAIASMLAARKLGHGGNGVGSVLAIGQLAWRAVHGM